MNRWTPPNSTNAMLSKSNTAGPVHSVCQLVICLFWLQFMTCCTGLTRPKISGIIPYSLISEQWFPLYMIIFGNLTISVYTLYPYVHTLCYICICESRKYSSDCARLVVRSKIRTKCLSIRESIPWEMTPHLHGYSCILRVNNIRESTSWDMTLHLHG